MASRLPTGSRFAAPASTYVVAVSRIEWNAPVNDSVFDFPNKEGPPVARYKALLLDVAKNQKAIEELQKQYTCHVVAEEEKFDSRRRRHIARGEGIRRV